MKNILDAIHDAKAGVRSSAHRIERLADAFRATGNLQVAEQLDFEAANMMASIQELSLAWDADMDEQLSHSQAMMGNLLMATINGNIRP